MSAGHSRPPAPTSAAADAATDAALLTPDSPEALAACLAEASSQGTRVLPLGADTRGRPGARPVPTELLLSTAALDAVLDHEPADLTLNAQAGLGLAALDDLLAAHGQWLPLQPYRRRGTLGGLLASAADGVLALGHRRPRDLIVGARVAHGDGALARSKGRVVKNVAGYDLPRLMVGSQGTLGVLVEACLRLSPRPEASATLVSAAPDGAAALAAADALLAGQSEPSFVDVLEGPAGARLVVGFDGLAPRVDGLVNRWAQALAHSALDAPDVLDARAALDLRTLLDDGLTTGDAASWRAPTRRAERSQPGAAPGAGGLQRGAAPGAGGAHPDAAPGTGGSQRGAAPGAERSSTDDGPARRRWVLRFSGRRAALPGLRDALARHASGAALDLRPGLGLAFATLDAARHEPGAVFALLADLRTRGHAVLLEAPVELALDPDAVWGPPGPDQGLMSLVKAALDPAGVLCPGRFVGGL